MKGFHGDKNLIRVIKNSVSSSYFFIETGTRTGRSLGFLANSFVDTDKELKSCEINEDYYKKAVSNCEEKYSNVRIFPLSATNFLESFWVYWESFKENRNTTFWLDAFGGVDEVENTLRSDLEFLTSKFGDSVRIFIDDVSVPPDEHFQNFRMSFDHFKDHINLDDYVIFFPDYEPNSEEMYHPPTGWCLIVGDRDYAEELKTNYQDILNWFDYGFQEPCGEELENLEKFEFATTACVRPELLEKTYNTFNECLENFDMRKQGVLYINIDPVPWQDQEVLQEKMKRELEIARYFFNTVKFNIGEEGGNFPKAVKWIFDQPKGDYFFHLEDDWKFWGSIDIEKYIRKMENDGRGRTLQCVTYQNGGGNRVHFPPNMMNNEVLSDILSKNPLPVDSNPEQHIKNLKFNKGVEYNVVSDGDVDREDIGRSWSRSRGIRRDFPGNNLTHFTDWDLSGFSGK